MLAVEISKETRIEELQLLLEFTDKQRLASNYEKRAEASAIYSRAVAKKEVTPRTECEACGAVAGLPSNASGAANAGAKTRVLAHHHDYAKPLDVVYLCGPCHFAVHYR